MPAKVLFQYQSTSGATFSVSPELVNDIARLIDGVRAQISAKRAAGCFVGYLSVPLSSKSGGDFRTNTEMAASITKYVQTEFGRKLWLLNPGAYNLPATALGGDYMAVWSDVLAGEDGSGAEFDLVYFVGPSDVWRFFGVPSKDRLGSIDRWLAAKASKDPAYKTIYDDVAARQRFVRYYGLRGSTIFSKGAHDEWNIVVALNAKRQIGDDIAVYFDGRPIEPGDYQVGVEFGNQILH
jgi:hypothetical protein